MSAETYCLANLIAEKSVVPESIQQEATGQNIGDYILKILQDQECYSTIKKDLQLVSKKLGDHNAYECAASYVGKFLKNKGELVG